MSSKTAIASLHQATELEIPQPAIPQISSVHRRTGLVRGRHRCFQYQVTMYSNTMQHTA
ncbi:MAG: hypothetical protein RMX35_26520 [Nostoc sp. DcaGUA01]|nr:hypothetical protein [Nostoc sp. DcaGUA01]